MRGQVLQSTLAFNPYRQAQEKVATISFTKLPSYLSSGAGRDVWRFSLQTFETSQVFDEEDDDDTPRQNAELVIDNHFRGIKPLRSFRKASDHKIEYLNFLQQDRTMSDSLQLYCNIGPGRTRIWIIQRKRRLPHVVA